MKNPNKPLKRRWIVHVTRSGSGTGCHFPTWLVKAFGFTYDSWLLFELSPDEQAVTIRKINLDEVPHANYTSADEPHRPADSGHP